MHVVVIAAAVAAVVAAGLLGLRAVDLPGPRPVLDGDRLKIQVVAPVEPRHRAGSVMEVGELVDVFQYVPPPRPLAEPAAYAPLDEDFGVPDSRPASKRTVEQAIVDAPPQPEGPERDRRDNRAGRWFGFDVPDRDYRAEREARRARREVRAAQDREGRSVRWYRSDGEPVDDRPGPPRDRDEGPPPEPWE